MIVGLDGDDPTVVPNTVTALFAPRDQPRNRPVLMKSHSII